VTFDGRLDNRQDLLLRYREPAGRQATNAELALAAYAKRGPDGLADLIGDWSLAIWDTGKNAVLLASDFAGVRPLYYSVERGRVVWSSRLQTLADWTGAYELDDTYIAALLTVGGCPHRTPYRGIYSVPPGHVVEISASGVKIQPFWKMPVDDVIRYRREAEYEEHLRTLFREAVRTRIPGSGAWLCELSGGTDSSSIAAMAAELLRDGEIQANSPVTLSFEHEGSVDERFYRKMAEFCGFENARIATAAHPFLTRNEPGGARPAFWESLRRRTAGIARERNATTYMTGMMGDIVMGNWHDDYGQVAGLLRTGRLATAFGQALAWSKASQTPLSWVLGRACLLSLPPRIWKPSWRRMQAWSGGESEAEDLLPGAFRKRAELHDPQALFTADWMQARPERRMHYRALMQMLEMRWLQAPEALEHLDYTHPFAHRPLVTFMLSIPANVVCRPGEPRRLMRRAFRPLWPQELRKRRSKGAFDGVFLDALRPLAAALFKPGQRVEVVERGYVDRNSLQNRLRRLDMAMDDAQLRQVILLECWLQQWSRRAAGALALPA
jgi:asparagine synthase (glutamine-hydrolysing)